MQEAWLRLAGTDDPDAVRDLRAWSTTVVARLCLDRLRSAAARRERHVGPWLPEPLVTTPDDTGPLAQMVRAEDVRMAAMVVLDRLGPAQRVAFVLHEALDLPYDEIGAVLGCSADAARQHAARARKALADAPVPPRLLGRRRGGGVAALRRRAGRRRRGPARRRPAPGRRDGQRRRRQRPGGTPPGRRTGQGVPPAVRAAGPVRPGLLDGTPVLVNGEPGWLVPGQGRIATAVTRARAAGRA